VFRPMAFFGGSTVVIYRQFSITIVSAIAPVGAGGADLPTPCAYDCSSGSRGCHDASEAASGWFNRGFTIKPMNRGYGTRVSHGSGAQRGATCWCRGAIVVAMCLCSCACRNISRIQLKKT